MKTLRHNRPFQCRYPRVPQEKIVRWSCVRDPEPQIDVDPCAPQLRLGERSSLHRTAARGFESFVLASATVPMPHTYRPTRIIVNHTR